jgi:hypothetical protein
VSVALRPIERALAAWLGSSTELVGLIGGEWNVYAAPAPEGTEVPYVTFDHAGTMDVRTFGARLERARYIVRGITVGQSKRPGHLIAEALDRRLEHADEAGFAVEGYRVLRVERDGPVDYPEVRDGRTYRHIGGTYIVEVEPA